MVVTQTATATAATFIKNLIMFFSMPEL
jgi:hypothetical protein